MHVSVLAAFLCVGKKYAIQQLFEKVEGRLLLGPSPLVCASKLLAADNVFLFPQISGNDSFNFTVMNIANKAGILSAVAMATFYICFTCHPLFIADGYNSGGKMCTLSVPNVQYCLPGQHYLAEVESLMVQSLMHLPLTCQNWSSRNHSLCTTKILFNLHSFQDFKSPLSVWVSAWNKGLSVMCQAEQGRGMKRQGSSYGRIYQSCWVLVLGKILTEIQGSPRVSIAQWTVQVIVGYGLFIHFGSLYSHTYGFNHGWKSMSYALYHCYYLRLTLWKPIVWPCMLQFSFSFATSFLFHLIPLVATGEDSTPWMILTLLS